MLSLKSTNSIIVMFILYFCYINSGLSAAQVRNNKSKDSFRVATSYGMGNYKCSKYVKVFTHSYASGYKLAEHAYYSETFVYLTWIQGYISAYNMYSGKQDIRGLDLDTIAFWINNWCKSNATKYIAEGADVLIKNQQK